MMYINKQVNPTQGVDFSKIRKAQKGTKITKFQTPANPLEQINWPNLTYAEWKQMQNSPALQKYHSGLNQQTTINNGQLNMDTHHRAENLNQAYQGIQNYTSNPNNVGADMQYFANQNQFTTPQEFMMQYNKNIDTLNASWEHNPAGNYNDHGWTNHNRLFKSMYDSRSNANGDIRYDDAQEDILGSSTWLRRVDQYEKRIADLTPEELQARTHEIRLPNGQIEKFVKESDGSIIPLSEVERLKANEQMPNPTPDNPKEPNNAGKPINPNPNNPQDLNKSPNPNDPNNPNGPNDLNPENPQGSGRIPFNTSFITNGIMAGIGVQGAIDQYNLARQNKVGLQQPVLTNFQVTDHYTTSKNQAQTMEEQRFKAMQGLGSDLTQNLDHKASVDQQVAENMQKLQTSDEQNMNNQRLQDKQNSNENNQREVATGNLNNDRLIANDNYVLRTRQALRAKIKEIKQSNFQNNAADYDKMATVMNQNADLQAAENNQLKFMHAVKQAQKMYDNKFGEDKNWYDDDEQVKAFWNKNYKTAKFVKPEDKETLDLIAKNNWDANTIKKAKALIKKYAGDENYAETFNPYNEDFSERKTAAYNKLSDWYDDAEYRLGQINANGENFILGGHYLTRPGVSSIRNFRVNPFSFKQGGRFDAYIKAHRDVQKTIDKNTNISIRQLNANLKRELDSLDKEQMLLLKEMFK